MSLLSTITDYLLNQSVHIIVLFAVVAVVCFALRKKTAHVRYLLWLIIIAKCLVPSLITVSLAILPSDPEPVASPVMVEAPLMADSGFIAQRVVYATPVAEPTLLERLAQIPPKMWFVYLWITGALGYALIAIAKAVRLNSYLVRKRKVIPEGLRNELDGFINNLPACYMVKGIAQPFVWGLVKGSIYLPANFIRSTTPEHRRQIVSHEAGHVARLDPLVNLLQIIAQTVFFFHPLVWVANRMIRAEREKCCDEIAIAGLDAAPRDYGSAIVETLVKEYESTIPIPSMAIAGPIKNIEDRIKTIMNPGKKFYKRPTVIALMSILLVAAFAIPTSFALTAKETDSIIAQNDNLTVLDMNIKPIRQGKNEVYITVHNETNIDQIFGCHLYSRSVDYGPQGVGWGTIFFETIKASSTKECRFVYKIQGPVTENTWLRFTYYNPVTKKAYLDKSDREDFYKVRFDAKDLEIASDKANLPSASKAQYRQASQTLRRIKSYIKKKEYDRVWNIFTEDYQKAEYQLSGIVNFTRTMEPTHPTMAAFNWDKGQFLKLKPKSAAVKDGKIVLTAFYEDQPWTIEFVKEGSGLKVDWIGGYRPAVLDMQEKDAKRDAEGPAEFVDNIIKGTVRDKEGKPVEGALVLPMPHGGYPVKTDGQGRYQLPGPDEETERLIYFVIVRVPEKNLAEAGNIKGYKNKDIDITLGRGITLFGSVVDADGDPIANAKVSPMIDSDTYDAGFGYTKFVPSDNDGGFRIRALPSGFIYDITANAAGYEATNVSVGRPDGLYGGNRQLKDIVLLREPELAKKIQVRFEAAEKLKKLGLMLVMYANDYDDKYPKELKDLKPYNRYEVYDWVIENVKYIAKENEFTAPAEKVVAYDHVLLKTEGGTNVLDNAGGATYRKADYLKKLGIIKAGGSKEDIAPEPDCQPIQTSESKIIWGEGNERTAAYSKALRAKITVDIDRSPDGSRLSVQYAVIAICEAAGVPYQLDKSAKMAEPQRRRFIEPVHVNISAKQALNDILQPVGLHYRLNNNGLYITNQKVVIVEARFLLVDQNFLDDIKDSLEIEFPDKDSQSSEFFDDDKINFLIRAVQAHANSKVLTAPKVTVWDGESAIIKIVKERAYVANYTESDNGDPKPIIETVEIGISMEVLPKITDQGHILIDLDAEMTNEIGARESVNADGLPIEISDIETLSITSKLVVPDGATVMFDGGLISEENEDGTTEKRRLLVLVKPSIKKPKTFTENK